MLKLCKKYDNYEQTIIILHGDGSERARNRSEDIIFFNFYLFIFLDFPGIHKKSVKSNSYHNF